MPYKHIDYKIKPEDDKRRKLSDVQKESIRELYKTGSYSQRMLAREFNVSRRLIGFVINPEKLEICKEQHKERRKDGRYYSKNTHLKYQKKHRRYKQELYLQNKLETEI